MTDEDDVSMSEWDELANDVVERTRLSFCGATYVCVWSIAFGFTRLAVVMLLRASNWNSRARERGRRMMCRARYSKMHGLWTPCIICCVVGIAVIGDAPAQPFTFSCADLGVERLEEGRKRLK